MVVSLFLAKFLGIFLFLVPLAMLLHTKRFDKIVKEVMDSPALLAITGIIAFLFGLLIVFFHNIWTKDWRVTITIFGWLFFIIGLLRLFCPDALIDFGKKLIARRGHYWLMMIAILFGLYLLILSFYVLG